jgi:non-canonical poly(A) RNA polymerase PAPD5/7
MDFLFLYGTQFNYEEVGISIRKGGFYFSKMKRQWMDTRNLFKLSVENPQDPTMDLGRGSYNIRKVQRAF